MNNVLVQLHFMCPHNSGTLDYENKNFQEERTLKNYVCCRDRQNLINGWLVIFLDWLLMINNTSCNQKTPTNAEQPGYIILVYLVGKNLFLFYTSVHNHNCSVKQELRNNV